MDTGLAGLSLAAGVLGAVAGTVCLFALRKQRALVERTNAELQSALRQHRVECSEQMARLGREVAVIELAVQNTESGGRAGLTKSQRSQAMQLIRSGVSPESAASTLGIANREMGLIAKVVRILSTTSIRERGAG